MKDEVVKFSQGTVWLSAVCACLNLTASKAMAIISASLGVLKRILWDIV